MKTIPQNLIRDKIYCVNYIEYLGNEGLREYFYIAVRQDEMDKFKEALKKGNFDADQYGMVLEHGKGSAPDFVRDKMKMLYKCDHESAININDYNPNPDSE